MNLFETALNPANKQVKRMMGQPDQGSLSTRPKRPSGKGRNRRLGGNNNQLSAQDLISLFQSMPVPNRGYRNPNADQPGKMGQGMAWFDENNSPDKVAGRLDRQNTEDWKRIQRGNNMGAAAVDFVKQTKGYTGADGVFVPPTMPATPSSAYGSGSVAFTDKPTRGTMTDPLTGKQVFMDEYLPQQSMVQDTKFGAMPGQENGGALTRPRPPQPRQAAQPQNDMAALFPGPSKPSISAPEAPMKSLGQRESERRAALGDVTRLPAQPQTPLNKFVPPGASAVPGFNTQEAPFGTSEGALTYGVPSVRGLFPNIAQGANALMRGAEGVWDHLAGNPNDAYQKLKQDEFNRAMAQYLSGLR